MTVCDRFNECENWKKSYDQIIDPRFKFCPFCGKKLDWKRWERLGGVWEVDEEGELMLKIGDLVVDEDGYIGVVGIRYNDGDFCQIENDSAHPNPRKATEDDVTRFAGNTSFRRMVKAALEKEAGKKSGGL